MKVKSITDVITNSSTEVFAMTSQKSVEDLKSLINLLLEAGKSEFSCDDLFDITLEVSEDAEDIYKWSRLGEEKSWEDMSEEEKFEWCLEKTNESIENFNLYPRVIVTPKSPDIPKTLIRYLMAAVDCGLSPVNATYG